MECPEYLLPHCVSCVARSLTNWPKLTARKAGKARYEQTLPPHLQPLLEPLILHWWPLRRAAERARARRSTAT